MQQIAAQFFEIKNSIMSIATDCACARRHNAKKHMEPTGDNTDLFLYMALAVISMAAVIRVSKKIKDDGAYINSFDADGYSVIIREEEKKGYRFIDTAKDIAKMDKEKQGEGIIYIIFYTFVTDNYIR